MLVSSQYIIPMEQKVYCSKKKSYTNTLLFAKINLPNLEPNVNSEKIKTLHVNKIQFKLNPLSLDYDFFESLLKDSTIIISSSQNPKLFKEHLTTTPGFLCDFYWTNKNQLEFDIKFNDFIPNGIPDLNPAPNQIPNQNQYYLLIQMKKLIESNLILDMNICIDAHQIIESDLLSNCYYKLDLIYDPNCKKDPNINSKKDLEYHPKDPNIYYQFIQDTRTAVISQPKLNNNCLKCNLNYLNNLNGMCRGFWIKMNLLDYNNLQSFTMNLDAHERFNLSLDELEILFKKKQIGLDIVIFINFELLSTDWDFSISKNFKLCKKIYSNYCNMKCFGSIKVEFKFCVDHLISKKINIIFLNGNLIEIASGCITKKI